MKRLVLVLTLALASISSVACTASSEPEEQSGGEEVQKSEDPLANTTTTLTCNRWRNGGCATLQTWCNNRGRDLKCDLDGNCYCAPAAVLSPQ